MRKARSEISRDAQEAELKALAARPEHQIDTIEIDEVRDWSGAKRGVFFRPVKHQLTLRVDADVIAWFKDRARGSGRYQTSMNRALREYMDRHRKKAG